MKHSILFISILIFTSGLVVPAQEQGGKKRPQHSGKITKSYDRARDRTTLKLEPMNITCIRDSCIHFGLISSVSGADPQASVNRILLTLSIFTKTLEPFADPTLFMQVDGNPLTLGAMGFAGKVLEDGVDQVALPYGIALSAQELTRMANARKVEMRLGSLQFTLAEDHINAISDYQLQAVREPSGGQTIKISEDNGNYSLTVPLSRLVMTVPKGGLVREGNESGGAAASPGYFLLSDKAQAFFVSGWFETDRRFDGIQPFWAGETTAWKGSGQPVPERVSFEEIGSWTAVVYAFELPGGASAHIRAHWVQAGTWIDLHLSLTSDQSADKLLEKLRKHLKAIQISEKKPLTQ